MSEASWKNFREHRSGNVAYLELATESKVNSYNAEFWFEFRDFLTSLKQERNLRALCISAEGKHFGGGMNVDYLAEMNVSKGDDSARYNHWIREKVIFFQEVIGLLDELPFPVIGLATGACIGGSLAIYSACDIRLADETAFFSIYEINVGIMCDLGTVQRINRLCGETLSSYLAFSGESIAAKPAEVAGLVTRCLDDKAALEAESKKLLGRIAGMSPLALAGLKETFAMSRDMSFSDSLKMSATWNAGMYTTKDIGLILRPEAAGEEPQFSGLYKGEKR